MKRPRAFECRHGVASRLGRRLANGRLRIFGTAARGRIFHRICRNGWSISVVSESPAGGFTKSRLVVTLLVGTASGVLWFRTPMRICYNSPQPAKSDAGGASREELPMDANTVLENLYYAVSVIAAIWGVAYGLWKDHKAEDDEGRKK